MKFGNEGNKAIFDDVFGSLRTVYNRETPLVGEDARAWDAKTLYREQYIIAQPIYKKQSAATISTLSSMAKGQGMYYFGVHGMLQFEGNIESPKDRYDHGMGKVLNYYRLNKALRKAYQGAGWE